MTLDYGFYNSVSGDRVYDAIDMSRIFDGMILDGVYAAIGDKLMVSQDLGTNMKVSVGTGRAWFDHTWSYNDAAVLLDIATADALLDRIDVVYIEINEGTGVRANSLAVLTGTPASEPVAPTLTNTSTVHQYPLAHVEVAAGVTAITNANIVNKVGSTETPFVTCPLEYVTTNEMLAQWEAEWEEWFDAIKDQLSTEAETNLQAQIWAIVGDTNPPLMDLIDLDTHDHTDYGDPIPSGGLGAGAVTQTKIADGAVTETKLGSLAVTEGKLGNLAVSTAKLAGQAVTAAKLGSDVAGNGLGGGSGSALVVNVDNDTLEISTDILRVKAEGITPNEIDNRTRYIWLPAQVFEPVSPVTKTRIANDGIRLIMDVEEIAVASYVVPEDMILMYGIYFYIFVALPTSGGYASLNLTWTEILEGRTPGSSSTGSNGVTAAGDTVNVQKKTLGGTHVPSATGIPVSLRLSRDSAPPDTNPGDAHIYGVLLGYIADS